jgi:divinyl protochlorophyllide a 8-vinyl-reductase
MSGAAVGLGRAGLASPADSAIAAVAPVRGPAENTVGPNAVIQIRSALVDSYGGPVARRLFGYAGLEAWFDRPPDKMVEADKVHRLNMALFAALGGDAFDTVMAEAGRRTGCYILENRIPRVARAVLRLLPARLAARILLRAIVANSWTFAGGATVTATPGHPAVIEIRENPLSMPGCAWHCAVFETLFSAMLRRPVQVRYQACVGEPGPDAFRLVWKG